jgi:hypothetical protein
MLSTAALALSACGGSAKRSSGATANPASTTARAPTAASSATAPASQPPAAGGRPLPPPEAHAEVPAIFNVLASGSLSPRTVSVPAALPVELTVVSNDGRRHTAVLRSPSPHALSVPAGGRASVLVSGLTVGTYALELDGADRAALVVGVAPGP